MTLDTKGGGQDHAGSATTNSPIAALAPLVRWESLLLIILVATILIGNWASGDFLTGLNFSNSINNAMEVAIMALAMTPIIITGDIDLSVQSMVGLSGAVMGVLWGGLTPLGYVPLPLAIAVALLVGVIGGLFNGVLVTRWGLPALVVTLGTLALYHGLAQVLLGTNVVTNFPAGYTDFAFKNIPGTFVPWTFPTFLILAVIFYAVLHRTWLGRQIFAIGKNKSAARYSGVRVGSMRTALFVVAGLIAAIAGVILALRFDSVRSSNGANMTLTVVTLAVLGGVDINGGKGTIMGVVLAVLTLAAVQSVLRLVGVSAYIEAAVGFLLIFSVTAPLVARRSRDLVNRVRLGGQSPSAGQAARNVAPSRGGGV
jgi:rhamnose transport system permease protein